MSSSNSHAGHRKRLRRRFLETGTAGFSDHELLELLLFYTLPRVNTNEIAHELIARFGNLPSVMKAEPEQLAEIKGLSSSSALFLKIITDMCEKYALYDRTAVQLASHEDIEKRFISYFSSVEAEICLILNVSMNLEILGNISLSAQQLSDGIISPRELAEIAIKNNIHRIIIGLNHPDRLAVPSENDYRITGLISNTLTPLGIDIYDCIVCGSEKAFSMRKNGAFSFISGAAETL